MLAQSSPMLGKLILLLNIGRRSVHSAKFLVSQQRRVRFSAAIGRNETASISPDVPMRPLFFGCAVASARGAILDVYIDFDGL